MSILKKGTKGKSVKDLQIGLNKAGAKPPLKEDSEFGPITEKAVKTFQKKFGLKNDGKVGDHTLATITFGKKLPEMKVGDYAPKKKKWSKYSDDNNKILVAFLKLSDDIQKLETIVGGMYDKTEKSMMKNTHNFEKIADRAKMIADRQKLFESVLIKNPTKAELLAKDCEVLERQIKSIGNAEIIPDIRNNNAAMKVLKKAINTTFGNARVALAIMEKSNKSSYSD